MRRSEWACWIKCGGGGIPFSACQINCQSKNIHMAATNGMACAEYESFVQLHGGQLRSSAVPEHLWLSLCFKLKNQVFDAGEKLGLCLLEFDEEEEERWNPFMLSVTGDGGIKADDANAVYLVDHAWTYQTDIARKNLEDIPSLLGRMCVIMGVDLANITAEEAVEQVLAKMWRFNNTYSINAGPDATIESQMPVWFIADEIGSAVWHSDDPNFRLIPFIYLPDQMTYSILFPIRDVEQGDVVTRDFVENLSERGSKRREALLLPWQWNDFRTESFTQVEPSEEYFLAGRIEESVPDQSKPQDRPQIDGNRPLRVYSEYSFINQFLTDPAFEIVDDENTADIFWYTKHFKGFKEFSERAPNKFVNQFPFENVLTVKDLLSCICRRSVAEGKDQFDLETLEGNPKWLPTTFNLNTEMNSFVSYFQHRDEKELDNHWIIKPWNLARGLDMQITNNLEHILRLPTTGPKIAQKYVENPVLFDRNDVAGGAVKFDVRYVILLKSAQPLEAYVYRNFFLRFSNKEFSLDRFDDYEKHFTVMNYTDTAQLKHLPCKDFLQQWEGQFSDNPWEAVETKICKMLREILENAVKEPSPRGLCPNTQSRALYAADIILEWTKEKEVQPKILEINWMPDCARACNYYPDFYNDIFKLLFLDDSKEQVFRQL